MLNLKQRTNNSVQLPADTDAALFFNDEDKLTLKNAAGDIETVATVEGLAAATPNPRVFKALVTQAGVDIAPTITVITNTLGVTITPSYISVGAYSLTASAPAFTANKTFLTFGSSILSEPFDPTFVKFNWDSATELVLRSKAFTPGGPTFDDADNLLTDLPISIEVYE